MSTKHSIIILILIFCSQLFFQSCRSISQCPDDPSPGNMGDLVNSKADDLSPMASKNKLVFVSNRKNKRKEVLFYSEIENKELLASDEFDELDFEKLKVSGSVSIFTDSENTIEYYFSASKPGRNADLNLYMITDTDGELSKPIPLKAPVNTQFFDSYPSVSPDGKYLVFSSDRPGGFGQTDLYISERNNGIWSAPINMGVNINTREEEISPNLSDDYTLHFSSKGYSTKSGFDIIKAKHSNGKIWSNSVLQKSPINTIADEIGSTILNGSLIVSSNRPGGCGGFDFYKFELCGPIFIEGSVISENDVSQGIVQLLDKDKILIEEKSVDHDNFYRFELTANNLYYLKYINSCYPEADNTEEIFAICSDSTSVKLIMNIIPPGSSDIFSFEKYGIPFFATGYYFPNTRDNLDQLKMNFEYKFLGKSDSTRYIENPGSKYDSYVETVEMALEEASEFIVTKLTHLNSHCSSGGSGLQIKVIGYTDPRPISAKSKYSGPGIHDPKFGINITPGDKIDNNRLSSLRAYFTSKLIQNHLETNQTFKQFKDQIHWEIDGSGIDDRIDVSDDLKRRVEIRVSVLE